MHAHLESNSLAVTQQKGNGMSKVLLLGGFHPGQSLWSIRNGFQRIGCEVGYQPTRGCIATRMEADIALAKEEADRIPDPSQWNLTCPDDEAFQQKLLERIGEEKPELLLWWFSKDDRPSGLIQQVRRKYPWCKTVTHTQDDPWDLLRNPQFSAEFEFAATCCKESLAVYESQGIKAIVLYPPPAHELHGAAQPVPQESCDFTLTVLSLYAREGGSDKEYLSSADLVQRITHVIPFPDQRALRQQVVAAIKDLGRIHIYGGLGFGTFEEIPRYAYRGFRGYEELPGIYAAAKINLNQHNSPQAHGYLNQRDTAITGSGGFMLTDYVEGIEEVFEIGKEIDTWNCLEELQDKAKWWLEHDNQRKQAAARAQQRILQDYGNEAYARKLIAFVQNAK